MCGRFTITKTEQELEKRFGANFYTRVLEARYNIAPTRNSPVLTAEKPFEFQFYRWGLIPFWAKDPSIGLKMINARQDTLAEKPAFRNALQQRRCLVIADSWYEWVVVGHRKQPYRILRKDREAFAFAGLWESWNPAAHAETRVPEQTIHSFTIITAPALKSIASIHDRMPALLLPSVERNWLDPTRSATEAMELLQPYPETELEYYPVSEAVNNARNEDPRLIEAQVPRSHPETGTLF
ncbi:MAG: SOS response-associated peptidase [Bacteroidetes bacterium]|nr:SOS response-associated peptidase [Bacteroidota bacterium]